MGLQGAEQHLEKWILCDVDKSLNLSGPQFHDAQNEEIGPDPPGPKSSYNLEFLFSLPSCGSATRLGWITLEV